MRARRQSRACSSPASATAASRRRPRKDYADAAAAVLTTAGHDGKVYELSGDYAWSLDEFAAAVAEGHRHDGRLPPVSAEEHAAILKSVGLDEGTVGFVTALDANIRDGVLADTSGELASLIGRPTTPLAEGLTEAL